MRRALLYGGAAVTLGAALLWLRRENLQNPMDIVHDPAPPPEAAPMCPWREPESDLHTFFPRATGYETETRILSGLRLELSQALGRPPAPDELSLRLYRVFRAQEPLGTVLTRRVKGQFGSIEMVLAVKPDGGVRALRLQRLREPAGVATALQQPEWLAGFAGKTASNRWRLGEDLPAPEPATLPSAQALVEGVRSLLILLSVAERSAPPAAPSTHHS